jgi:pyruvate kinase
MEIRTKIICTMGPSVNTYEKILELIDAGMNVARLNFSHGTHENHLETINLLKKARKERGVPLAIMLDTKGPEIRIGKLKNDALAVASGVRVMLVKDAVEGDEHRIQLTPSKVFESVELGTRILIDDGYIISEVVEINQKGIVIEFQNTGQLKSHKGVNIPSARINLPAMTKQDIEDITFGCKQDVDIIAASFIRSVDHVIEIKRLLISKGKPEIFVIAKIESPQGVENFDSIVQVADGIMVARGDLGVELPLQEVPSLQKMMIKKCYHIAKPVVTATQMLESMIKNPRPTRAEVSDVANAIYDSTSAVMLSGETAVGQYPIEAVRIMKKIIVEAEENFNYKEFFSKDPSKGAHEVSAAVCYASVKTAYNSDAKAIFAFTNSGLTARVLSKCRPQMPVIALTSCEKTYHQMGLYWGVTPVDPKPCSNLKEAFALASEYAKERGLVSYGDLVVITAGAPFGISGSTNTMMVESIGDVLVRGKPGYGNRIHGKVAMVITADEENIDHARDKIAILSSCGDQYLPILKTVAGIVLQSHPDDPRSEKSALHIAKSLGIPIITRAEGALVALKEGQLVTMDPKRGLIYKGSISTEEEARFSKNS